MACAAVAVAQTQVAPRLARAAGIGGPAQKSCGRSVGIAVPFARCHGAIPAKPSAGDGAHLCGASPQRGAVIAAQSHKSKGTTPRSPPAIGRRLMMTGC